MRETQWIEWIRTLLQQAERDDPLAALTTEQESHLLEHDYVWVESVGVPWKPADGAMRRARFTHATHFRRKHGEFCIDSEGSVSELSNPIPEYSAPVSAARPYSLGARKMQTTKAA
jgi:hypothetical protein